MQPLSTGMQDVPPLAPCHPRIALYLNSPPFYGESDFAHKEAVKKLCGAGTARWDAARKLWGTASAAQIEPLLRSGFWKPVGLEKPLYNSLITEVAARAEHMARTQKARAEALAAKREQEQKQALAAEAREARKKEDEQRAAAAKEASAKAEAQRARQKQLDRERANHEAELATGIPLERAVGLLPTTQEVEQCAALGFEKKAIEHSVLLEWLGPCDGTSIEGRLLRWVSTIEYHVRDAHGDIFFDAEKLAPHQQEHVGQFVSQLNSLASS